MGKLLVVLLLGACAFAFANHIGIAPALPIPGLGSTGVVENGREVLFTTDVLEIRFTSGAALDDEFVVFGGKEMPEGNSLSHALVSGLPGEEARAIASRHPDFHLCASPGAAAAKRFIRGMNFVASNTGARDALGDALDRHLEGIRTGGERSCVRVKGASLELESVTIRESGDDVTSQIRDFVRASPLYLAREAEVVDCESMLR